MARGAESKGGKKCVVTKSTNEHHHRRPPCDRARHACADRWGWGGPVSVAASGTTAAQKVGCLTDLQRRRENRRHPTLAKTLLECEVAWAGVPLRLFASHLASRHDLPATEDEIAVILRLLAPLLLEQPHLLVGDFNALHRITRLGTRP